MPRLEAAAGHPHRKRPVVVVAAVAPPLVHRRPPKLASPRHEGVVEEAALLEIEDEGGARLIGVGGVLPHPVDEIAVGVPGLVEQLHEADTALEEPAGEETVAGIAGLGRIGDPVAIENGLRLAGEIHQLRRARLEPVRHLVALDPGGDLRIADRVEGERVEPVERVERGSLRFPVDPLGVGEIEDRIAGAAKGGAAVEGGEEAGAVVARSAAGASGAGQHDIAGKILRLAPQAVERPGPEARPAELLRAGVHQNLRRRVIDRVGLHRTDDADVVGDSPDVGQQLARIEPASA